MMDEAAMKHGKTVKVLESKILWNEKSCYLEDLINSQSNAATAAYRLWPF